MSRHKLIEIAAECHCSKWQFDADGLSKADLRALAKKAFDVLHKIGDRAISMAKDENFYERAAQKDVR